MRSLDFARIPTTPRYNSPGLVLLKKNRPGNEATHMAMHIILLGQLKIIVIQYITSLDSRLVDIT